MGQQPALVVGAEVGPDEAGAAVGVDEAGALVGEHVTPQQ